MIKGFYKDKKGNNKAQKGTCAQCKLYENAKTYAMKPHGNFKKHILNIGESPGEKEDDTGIQFQGKIGRILKRTYRRLGIDLFDDCLNINSVNCRPANNKTPTKKQITCCRNMVVEETIQKYKPDIIVLFGSSAISSFLGHRYPGRLDGADKWRGYCIPDREYKAWVCPVFHPSYVARMDEEVENIWKWDLERIVDLIDKPLPVNKKPKIDFIEDLSVLYDIKSDVTAFDYETTGIKPHTSGHRIVSCAIADTPDHAYVFMMPKKRKDQKPFLDYLKNPAIGKVAANMVFEEMWSRERLNIAVQGWQFDTMLAGHQLDNRPGVSNLDFQTYVNFGIIDYSSFVKPYLKPQTEESANAFNRILELVSTEEGKNKLLTYNGYDTIYELRLAWQQIEQIDYDFLPMFT